MKLPANTVRQALREISKRHNLTLGRLNERDRYLVCKVRSKKYGRAFLKIAKVQGPNLLLRNQIVLDKNTYKLLKQQKSFFNVPRPRKNGRQKGYDYYISEDVGAKVLYRIKKNLKPMSTAQCKILAAVHRDFLGLPPFKLPLDSTKQKAKEDNKFWIEAMLKELKRLKMFRSQTFAKIFRLAKKGHLQVARFPRYGDLLPWHIYKKSRDTFYLIDSELACSYSIRWADIAWCATALSTDARDLEAGHEVVKYFREILPLTKRRSFDTTARYAFAQRCIYALFVAFVIERTPERKQLARAFVKSVEQGMFCSF